MIPTMQEIDELCERSKDDREIIVGSEIRMLCAAARRGVEADAEIARQEDLCRLSNATYKNIAEKAEAELAALKVERDEAVRREREAISKMAADLEEGQSVTTKLVLRLLTDRIRARKGEHDEQH